MSDDKSKKDKEESQSKRIRRIAEARFTTFRSPDGRMYGIHNDRPVQALRHGKPSQLVNAIALLFDEEYDQWPNSTACAELAAWLEATTEDVQPVPLRSHWEPGERPRLLVDIGDDDWTIVEIDGEDFRICAQPGVTFRRGGRNAAMPWPLPARGDGFDFGPLWELIPVAEADRPVVLALLITVWMQGATQPVVLLIGPQDAGKTTSGRFLLSLVDPMSGQRGGKLPEKEDEWKSRVANARVILVDNHSTMTAKVSDMLCLVSTGGEMTTRELYSNDGAHTTELLVPVWLTSIDTGILRGDLASRVVRVELEGLTEARRIDEEILAARQNAARPVITGELFSLVVGVFNLWPTINRTGLKHRHTTFAIVLRCIDTLLGTDGSKRVEEQSGELAADVLDGDPLAQALLGLLDKIRGGWLSGDHLDLTHGATATELLSALNDVAFERRLDKGHGWPTTPKVLSSRLARIAPDLKKVHQITLSFERTHGTRRVRVVKT